MSDCIALHRIVLYRISFGIVGYVLMLPAMLPVDPQPAEAGASNTRHNHSHSYYIVPDSTVQCSTVRYGTV